MHSEGGASISLNAWLGRAKAFGQVGILSLFLDALYVFDRIDIQSGALQDHNVTGCQQFCCAHLVHLCLTLQCQTRSRSKNRFCAVPVQNRDIEVSMSLSSFSWMTGCVGCVRRVSVCCVLQEAWSEAGLRSLLRPLTSPDFPDINKARGLASIPTWYGCRRTSPCPEVVPQALTRGAVSGYSVLDIAP